MRTRNLTWFEFFAGGGMARLGMGDAWNCRFANEWCTKKASAYRAHFGQSPELKVEDVAKLSSANLPGTPRLVWASFPCQDLSLAGAGAGLRGKRSGTFKPFWNLINGLIDASRRPRIVVLENVPGAITSHGGKDFTLLIHQLVRSGYWVGAIVVDAKLFLPQSRPRLFIVGFQRDKDIPFGLTTVAPDEFWHPRSMQKAHRNLSDDLKRSWVWWALPRPINEGLPLIEILEEEPTGVGWHSAEQTERLLSQMSPSNLIKVQQSRVLERLVVGAVYKRTRRDDFGRRIQRAEVRFDDLSGCLRTPVGGSSRQIILFVNGGNTKSRLISGRETARLMGVPDYYPLPTNYNEAYHLFGDGVAVPVVRHLEKNLLHPLAEQHGVSDAA